MMDYSYYLQQAAKAQRQAMKAWANADAEIARNGGKSTYYSERAEQYAEQRANEAVHYYSEAQAIQWALQPNI